MSLHLKLLGSGKPQTLHIMARCLQLGACKRYIAWTNKTKLQSAIYMTSVTHVQHHSHVANLKSIVQCQIYNTFNWQLCNTISICCAMCVCVGVCAKCVWVCEEEEEEEGRGGGRGGGWGGGEGGGGRRGGVRGRRRGMRSRTWTWRGRQGGGRWGARPHWIAGRTSTRRKRGWLPVCNTDCDMNLGV